MLQGLFIALGAAALVLMLSTGVAQLAADTRAVFALVSAGLWFLWGINASAVTTTAASTTLDVSVAVNNSSATTTTTEEVSRTVTESYPSLAIVGLALGGVMTLSFVVQAIGLFGDR